MTLLLRMLLTVTALLTGIASNCVYAQNMSEEEAFGPPTESLPATDAPDRVESSTKPAWNAIPPFTSKSSRSTFEEVLLYIPHRILDLLDIFRADVGLGPSAGATIRFTEYVQAGYRDMLPGSLRIGLLGRRAPVMLEESREYGFAPFHYRESRQRNVCQFEIGAGVDVFIAGAYAGLCIDELYDFFAGLLLIDPLMDDSL